MRSPTKAQAILNEAAMRLRAAEAEVDAMRSALATAEAVFEAHQRNYAALEKSLARAPRKVTKKTVAIPAQGAIVAKMPNCNICGQSADHADHDTRYLSSHEFEPGKSSAPSVGKKSARKTRAQQSEVNSETEKVAVGAVAGGSNE